MMDDNAYQQSLMGGPGDPTTTPGKKLTTVQKQNWNNFIDYLDKAGYKGSTDLDNRDTNLGKNLLAKYNTVNPNAQINYEDVPSVQGELQNYRQVLVNKWKAGTVGVNTPIKSDDEIMPNLSPVDGWLGSKTSSYKFPTATLTHADGTKQNFGVNTDLYDKLIQPKTK